MKITFAGLKTTGKVETVWAVIELRPDPKYGGIYDYLFLWGRRNGKLRTLVRQGYQRPAWNNVDGIFRNVGMVAGFINKKIKHGYEPVAVFDGLIESKNLKEELSAVYPGFDKQLDKLAVWETLKL